jgi:hypothetical protein
MAITIYYRHKTDRAWRYSALGVSHKPEAAKNGPFFVRIRKQGKHAWQKHLSELEAKKAAESAPVERKAEALGWLPDDVTGEVSPNRMPIKTAVDNYLSGRRFGRSRSVAVYENVFEQLLANLPVGVQFINRLANKRALNAHVGFLWGHAPGKAPTDQAIRCS